MSDYSFHQMSRQTSVKDYFLMIMTRQQIQKRMDELGCKLAETHDKKIITELYELALQLEKLKKDSAD
jgi:hypothetical protein